MSETRPTRRQRTRNWPLWMVGGLLLAAILGWLSFLSFRALLTRLHAPHQSSGSNASLRNSGSKNSNSLTIVLGAEESGLGLKHVLGANDGQTTVEEVNGTPARCLRLTNNRASLFFYFQIDPMFKTQDLRQAEIEIEFFDPEAGTLGVHYDSLDGNNDPNPKYRDATKSITITGSQSWQKASFRTRHDAAFGNRENGQSDFRIWAKTPVLYLRRVTLTPEPMTLEKWDTDLSSANSVSVMLGQEKPEDGLHHIADAKDGTTTIQNLDGVPCRLLNRSDEGKNSGFFYFSINPTFKQGINNAKLEIEYLAKRGGTFRLHVDGRTADSRRNFYATVYPEAVATTGAYARIPTVGTWAVATFRISNPVFMNSQNAGADFRLEVSPPELYVRRVTLTREAPAPTQSQPAL